ncbi:polyprotein [Shrew hepatovirus KS121232Sorara2012]|uniref:Genome polyprotein n=5 Tax=Hepatovirus TaxID=12091 RepID=A0A0S1M3B2_9PICO|nr:polyprotein [Shrew hepatovirus KS121232Sorara2012]ALL35265.1 polyprotein [Shrew hepatovirus KS121232Sorara2012]
MLQSVGRSLDRILTLSELEEEQVMQTPDRVSVAGAGYFTSVDQGSVHAAVSGSHQKERLLTSVDIPGSKKTQGERFFLIQQVEWNSQHVQLYRLLDLDVVAALMSTHFSVDGLLKYHTYARFGLEVQVQINPTPFQQGGLNCALIPGAEGDGSLTCMTMYPHGLLNCNINNVVRIKVPFVYTRGAYNLRKPVYRIWSLVIRVWSQLYAGTGTTTYVTVSVLARMTDLELHGLTPVWSQMMRKEFRISTTENVVNLANYEDARAKISFALDQENFRTDPSEAGGIKITNFSTWTSVPSLAGEFAFNASATAGEQIRVIPVSPYYFTLQYKDSGRRCVTSLASIAQMYCFWRGDIVFDFQVFPTKYHSGRLLFSFIPGNENTDLSGLTMAEATSGPCAVMDIGGTNSTLRFRVPWICDTPYRVNRSTTTVYLKSNHFHAIGKLVVFCYNRLSNPSNVVPHVKVNVYTSAINFECFAPIYSVYPPAAVTQAGEDGSFSTSDDIEQNRPDPSKGPQPVLQHVPRADRGKIDLDEGRAPVGAVTIIEDPLLAQKIPQTFPELSPGQTRHTSDHMDIYKYMGRSHFLTTFTFTTNNKQFSFPITLTKDTTQTHQISSTLQWFFSMIHLYRGPLDLTLVVSGSTDVDGIVWFTPANMAVPQPWVESDSTLSIDYKASLGAVRFNTRRTGNIQVRVPWYTDLSYISGTVPTDDGSDGLFGTISVQIKNYDRQDEYLSISAYLSITEQSEFYFPRAPLDNSKLQEYPNSNNIMREECVESSVDAPPQPIFELWPSNPYRELRLEVGQLRLEQAKKDFDESKHKYNQVKKETKAKFLKQAAKVTNEILEGGVYTQALLKDGNYIKETGDIFVRIDKGVYQYGFFHGKEIVTFDVKSWFSKMRGVSSKLIKVPMDGWMYHEVRHNLHEEMVIIGRLVTSCPFEFEGFDYKDVAALMDKNPWNEVFREKDKIFQFFRILQPRQRTVIDQISDSIVKSTNAEKLSEETEELVSECKGLIQSVKTGLANAIIGFRKKKWMKWVKLALKLVKYGLVIYLSSKIEDPFQLKLLLGISLLDLGVEFLDCSFIWSEAIFQAIEHSLKMKEAHPGIYTQSLFSRESRDWLRDAVAGITVFKAGKDAVLWLIGKIKEWYDKFSGKQAEILDAIKTKEWEIRVKIQQVDDYLAKPIKDSEKEEDFQRGLDHIRSLRTFLNLTDTMDLKKYTHDLRDSINRLHQKIRNLGHVAETSVSRPEPVVCYLYGERGSGKSLASMALATKICIINGVDPKKNIYTKPVGSDYWDGYSNQLVCIIDDMGQCTDDEDWSTFCQLVSGCPLRLNMASLEEKGKHFTTPYIICTSNLADPSPKTVYVKEAISRRLHYKIGVIPISTFVDPQSGCLDVEKAKQQNAIKDMSCLVLSVNGVRMPLSNLVNIVVDHYGVKSKNMMEFIDAWSQGIGSSSKFADDMADAMNLPRDKHKQQKASTKLQELWEKLCSHKILILKSIIGIVLALITAYGGYKAYKKFFGKKKETEGEDVETSGAYHGSAKKKPVIKLKVKAEEETQSVINMTQVVKKNLVLFGIGKPEAVDVHWNVNALGVKDEWLLVPSHAFKFEEDYESKEFYVDRNGVIYSAKTGSVQIFQLDVGFQDVVLMKIPSLPKFKDITHHFIQKKDLDLAVNRLATLVTSCQGTPMMISEGSLKYEDKYTYNHRKDDGSVVEMTIGAAWRGTGEGTAGMCGGALISANQKIQNAIIGIHVAGGKNTMISKVIVREMFDNIEQQKIESQRIAKIEFTQCSVNMISKTLIHKSPIHDYIDGEKINYPAAMPFSKKNEIDPIQVMLSKYSVPIAKEPWFYEEMFNYYLEKVQGLPYVIDDQLTIEEAIEGVEGIEPINMKSSPGLPYVVDHLRKDDLIWKDDKGKVIMIHPFLKQRIEMNLAFMDNGSGMDVVYVTCPKDELRPLEKVLESKTRAIEACPLDFTIICRMLWGPAISYFQLNPGFHTGVAVGLDPDSDWNSLFKKMKLIGDYGLDLDFSGFDASVSPFMIDYACLVLSQISGISMRDHIALYKAIAFSSHQILNMRYYVHGSMPSGTPCTSLLNSIINNINLHYVFTKILGKSPVYWKDKIQFICYGDDVMVIFSRDCEIENLDLMCKRVQEIFKQDLEMTVTSASKGVPKVVPVEELTFLKRSFNFVQGIVRPAIAEKTIWSLIAWKRNDAEFKQNLETAAWFAFMHGFEYYVKFKKKVDLMLRHANLPDKLPSYTWMMMRFKDLDFTRDIK